MPAVLFIDNPEDFKNTYQVCGIVISTESNLIDIFTFYIVFYDADFLKKIYVGEFIKLFLYCFSFELDEFFLSTLGLWKNSSLFFPTVFMVSYSDPLDIPTGV